MKKLAILGGTPIRSKKFNYNAPIGIEEKNAVLNVLDTKVLSGFFKNFEGGEQVQAFEKLWAQSFEVDDAIAVNSGTSALHTAIAAAGIGPGDEVIVSSYSFTASAAAIVMNNAIPIFCDIDSKNFNIDVSKLEGLITDRTKAIIPVHLFGQPADMDTIMSVAKKNDLMVIEDTCQAPGTKYKGKITGSIGHLGVFSTVETKNIVTGEGGVIITNDKDLAYRCRLIRNHGEAYMDGKPRNYLSNMLGYNFRPTEIQAAIGIEQLKKLNSLNDERNKLANYLINNMQDIKGLKMPESSEKSDIIHHLLCLQYDELETGVSRNKYIEALNAEGLELTKGYPRPMYMNPIFTEKIAFGSNGCPFTCSMYGKDINYGPGLCPVSELVCDKAIFITHIRPPNTLEDMKDIVKGFHKVNQSIHLLA